MSRLTDFAAAGFGVARGVIGGEALAIDGGTSVSAVLAEAEHSRDGDGGPYDRDQTLEAVVSIGDFSTAYPNAYRTYLGKDATARGRIWRVGSIRAGQAFVTVRLTNPRKGA